ncbi:MAG: helix-turn-helix domain-containing protein [Lachnospiraceae bacterium]|nr:helix-turn-helix domain-containing protein [Lachnospiraceae bacterium]
MRQRYESGVVPKRYADARGELAAQLKRARLSRNLTQQALADLAGTKRSNISRLESGKYNPSLDFLMKVADSLGLELNIHMN